MTKTLCVVVFSAMVATGCSTTNEETGTLLGVVAGGVLGNQVGSGRGQTIATFAGMAAGAFAGGAVGRRMDEVDRQQMINAQAQSLEFGKVGETTEWSNPDSGTSGSVSPVRTFQNAEGQYCREFQQQITIGGQTEDGFGTACRQADGSWRII